MIVVYGLQQGRCRQVEGANLPSPTLGFISKEGLNGAILQYSRTLTCTSRQNQFSIIFVTDSKFVSSSGKLCAELHPALW
jgi:hypothetical protein